MILENKLTVQQRADRKRQAKRKETPTFSPIRFSGGILEAQGKKNYIEAISAKHGGNREQVLLDAFKALEKAMNP